MVYLGNVRGYLGNTASYSSARMSSWPTLRSRLLSQKFQAADDGEGLERDDEVNESDHHGQKHFATFDIFVQTNMIKFLPVKHKDLRLESESI